MAKDQMLRNKMYRGKDKEIPKVLILESSNANYRYNCWLSFDEKMASESGNKENEIEEKRINLRQYLESKKILLNRHRDHLIQN
jgi:hypothetical protein